MHSMENGGWDLSKVDLELMKESKAAFVFGQMNEPPGARARVVLSGLTLAEYYRDGDGEGQGRDVLFFVDNISVLHKLVLRCLHFLGVCLLAGRLPTNL